MPIQPDAGNFGVLFGGILVTRKSDHHPVFQVKAKASERMVLFKRGEVGEDLELAEEVAKAFEIARHFAGMFGFALFDVDEINQAMQDIPSEQIPEEWDKRKDFTLIVTNYVTGERVEMVVAVSKKEMD